MATRLAVGVATLVAILAVLAAVSTVALGRAVAGFGAASAEAEHAYVPVVKLRALFPQNEVAAWETVLSGDTTSDTTYHDSARAIDAGFDELVNGHLVSPDQAQDLIQARLSWIQARGIIEELVLRRRGTAGLAGSTADRQGDQQVLQRLSLYSSALHDTDTFIGKVEAASSDRLSGRLQEAERTKRVAVIVVIGVGLAGAVAAIAGGQRIARSILAPIRRLSGGFAALRAGDFTHRTKVTGQDEFADLAEDFNAMAEVIENGRDSLAHQALHDALTGLANRVLLADRINHALAHRDHHDGALGLLVIDLDGFKQVNDTMGHQCGDVVLQTVADRLRSCVRLGDTVARLGGDEFAVLLTQLDREETAFDIAARMVEAVQAEILHGEHRAKVGASVGVAFSTATVISAEDLLRNADLAMYAAKQRGKGRWDLFEAAMHEQSVARARLEVDLRAAIQAQAFVVHYQPVVDLGNGEVTGFEALVRWQRSDGVVPPDAFIPVAEDTGLIVPLGRHVLFEACGQLGRWNRERGTKAPLRMAVNVSARQLADPGLVDDVAAALAAGGVEAGLLVLELTETALINNPTSAGAHLAAIRALGVRIAIDDFGTGYSSLSYLQSFPLDEIKIDRSFVANLADDASGAHAPGHAGDRSIVAAVIGMAHAFGYEVVAEGVESAEQLEVLVGLGCESGQGYFWAKPLPAPESGDIAARGLLPVEHAA